MKANIVRCDYNGNKSKRGNLWKWKETCDRCGTVIRSYEIFNFSKPDTEEADFCLPCMQWMIENGITYEEATKQYKDLNNGET